MNLLDVESNKRLIEDNNALVSSYLQKKLHLSVKLKTDPQI